MDRPRNASVVFVLVILLLDALGGGLIIPVLPGLLQGFLGGDIDAVSRYYGVFLAVYAAMQLVFAPILGGLSDRYGRRVVILLSLFGAACDYLLLALSPSVGWLFLGRMIAGITSANFAAATAYIADISPPERRATRFGLASAMFGIGLILGPVVGGALGNVHVRLPFFFAATLNLINLLYGLFVLPESLPEESRRRFSLRRSNPFSSLRILAGRPVVVGLTSTMFFSWMAQQIVYNVWALYTQARFGWSALDIGVSLACFGALTALVQAGLLRVLLPRLGGRRVLLLGLAANLAGFAAVGLATRGWMLYALMIPSALGGLVGPVVQGLLSSEIPASEQGELQGSLGSVASLTAILGPLLGTWLFARFAPETASPRILGVAFFVAAGFTLAGLLRAQRLLAKQA